MNTILKKPYELSLWEDIAVFEEGIDASQYFKESKIAVIGSSTMTAPSRACNVTLKENINSTTECTFEMYSKYFDDELQEFVDNPFFDLIINERKIKLHYNDIWYDFIVKDKHEISEDYKYVITCTDIFVNELAKNGYNLEFKAELNNNSGNITELANAILENSDWTLGESDIIQQKVDEPLYKVKVLSNFVAYRNTKDSTENQETINAGTYIYVYYSLVENKPKYFQFIYSSTGYTTDENGIINNENCTLFSNNFDYSKIDLEHKEASNYRGYRYVHSQKSKYDKDSEYYVKVYKDNNGIEYYGFEDVKYNTTNIVKNFITNNTNFTNTSTWEGANNSTVQGFVYPNYDKEDIDINITVSNLLSAKNYLKCSIPNGGYVVNNSFAYNYSNIFDVDNNKNFINIPTGTKFIFRFKAASLGSTGMIDLTNLSLRIVNGTENILICNGTAYNDIIYEVTNDIIRQPGKTYFILTDDGYTVYTGEFQLDTTYYEQITYHYFKGTTSKPISYNDAKDKKIEIRIYSSNNEFYLEDVQLFREISDSDGHFIKPGDVPKSSVITYYYYYIPGEYSADNLIGYTEPLEDVYFPVYNNQYESVRSIEAEKSNRFNLLQELCETFECWLDINVAHELDGSIKLDENNKPIKKISFKEYIGIENYAGFKYGINLNGIERTINSEQIVTKLIVEPNTNEVATNGFCSIQRAEENPYKTSFLLNFDYYINNGILDATQVYNDLYVKTPTSLGYLTECLHINRDLEYYNETYNSNKAKIVQLEADAQASHTAFLEAYDLYNTTKTEFIEAFAEVSLEDLYNTPIIEIPDVQRQEAVKIANYKYIYQSQQSIYNSANAQLETLNQEQEIIENSIDFLTEQIKDLDIQFYKKYSQYIQEGTWTSEDYYDDNLYYLDAVGIANSYKNPEINYTIKVVEVSELEDLQLYEFHIGDKTFIEDTDYFGYHLINGVKTPIKQEIVISEVVWNLDDPSQNTITVQNYKTQFEDLFNRISATIQSVEYKTGAMRRAAATVTQEGTIDVAVLEDSLANNNLILQNSGDQSVIFDHTGITVTNLLHPNELIRIVGGGVMLSIDGGVNWTTGVSASGINANAMTAGRLDTSVVNIFSSNTPIFKWDDTGISAYAFSKNNLGKISSVNYNKFIRMDQFGFYGFQGSNGYIFEPKNVEQIIDKASFGFVWSGGENNHNNNYFFLRSNHGIADDDGRVSITSNDDIQVFGGHKETSDTTRIPGKTYYTKDNNLPPNYIIYSGELESGITYYELVERVKIGLLDYDGTNTHYGMRISNNQGEPALITSDWGTLWLQKELDIGPNPADLRTQLGFIEGWPMDLIDPQTEQPTGKSTLVNKIFSIKGNDINVAEKTHLEHIFNNENFVIFDDGYIYAKNAHIEGNVSIKNGFFTGSVYATDGEFNGSIYSTEGLFGNSVAINDTGLEVYKDDGNWAKFYENGLEILSSNSENNILTISAPIRENGKYKYIDNITKLLDIIYVHTEDETRVEGKTYYYKTEDGYEVWPQDREYVKEEAYEKLYNDEKSIFNNYKSNLFKLGVEPQEVEDTSINRIYFYHPEKEAEWIVKPAEENINAKTIYYNLTEATYFNREYNYVYLSNGKYTTFYGDKFDEDITYYRVQRDDNPAAANMYLYHPLQDNWVVWNEDIKDNKVRYYIDAYVPVKWNDLYDENIQYFLYEELEENTETGIHITKNFRAIKVRTPYEFKTKLSTMWLKVSEGDTYDIVAIYEGHNIYLKNVNTDEYVSGNLNNYYIDVRDVEKDSVFYISGENAVVKGIIYARGGKFDDVQINSGVYIGDSSDNGIILGDGVIKSSNYDPDRNIGFTINKDGTIHTNEIHLNHSAVIDDYIELGSSRIYNPNNFDGKFIEAGEFFNINTNSTGNIGNIEFDGSQSIITASGWSLTPELAEFTNASISGKIIASTFETNNTSVAGGSMLFKTAARIKEINIVDDRCIITLEQDEASSFSTGQKVSIIKSTNGLTGEELTFYKVKTIENSSNQLEIEKLEHEDNRIDNWPSIDCNLIITMDVGIENNDDINDWVIGINATDAKKNFNLFKNSLTFSNIIKKDEAPWYDYHTHIVLGDITSVVKSTTPKFGLYAENVHLLGQLTTQLPIDTIGNIYAGISSETGQPSTVLSDKLQDNTSITFWAGAEDYEKIGSSLFHVTQAGSVYAQKAYFSGTIITDSDIYASDLHATTIHGWEKVAGETSGQSAALTIKDADIGINFVGGENNEIFTVKKDEVVSNTRFVVNSDMDLDTLLILNNKANINKTDWIRLYLTEDIGFYGYNKNNNINTDAGSPLIKISAFGYTATGGEENNKGLSFHSGAANYLDVGETLVKAYNDFQIMGNIKYNEILEYKRKINVENKIIGYDLFVYEES